MRKRVSSAFDKFYDLRLKTEEEIVKFSRELKIDIAIDLMCFTKYHKFGIFVKKCAPIQVNYLGYPGTSGTNYLDYIIADKILIPKDSQKYYSEKIVYLPDTYQANDSTKKISDKIVTREELGLRSKWRRIDPNGERPDGSGYQWYQIQTSGPDGVNS